MPTSPSRTAEPVHHIRSRSANGPSDLSAPRIGSDLEARRIKLIDWANELADAAPSQLAGYLDGIPEVLNRLECRVAVIGQVKAGKSTFINAFIQRPSLLPTNVNPWTTAVTHLHFTPEGVAADCAARFTFFSSDEWARIIHGGGPLRELTERFVPGFGVELLQQHVNAMRKRCEQRLGSELGTLFGTAREFAEIDADILAEYICAGHIDDTSNAAIRTGRYSDVVKSADLYLGNSTFSFPATLIDTPGTNDPFLVRDEITRQSLVAADIHIIVLSARQALGDADVALLHILHGLNKKNVILFINRIDELSNVGAESRQVVEDVRRRLRKAFPQAELKIIAGSASWAQLASRRQDIDVTAPAWRKAQPYAAELGLHSLAPAAESATAASVLMQCSGLPQVYSAVSEMMAEARSGHTLRQVRAALREIAQISPPILLRSIRELEAEEGSEGSRELDTQSELRDIEHAVRQSEQLLQLVHCVQVDAQARTTDIISDALDGLVDQLQLEIDDFVRTECAALRNAISSGERVDTWMCQAEPLRQILDDIFLDQIEAAEDGLTKLESMIREHLQAVIGKLQLNIKLDGAIPGAGGLPAVSSGALRRPLALDLGEPWWRAWWRGSQDGFARAMELERIIRGEFDPIVNELHAAAHNHLTARQSAGLKSVTGLCLCIFEALRDLGAARFQRLKTLTEERGQAKIAERAQARECSVAELRRRIAAIEILVRGLTEADAVLDERHV